VGFFSFAGSLSVVDRGVLATAQSATSSVMRSVFAEGEAPTSSFAAI
jgi:hypothetical protein